MKSVIPRDGDPAAHTVDIDTARGLLYLQRYQSMAAPPVPLANFDRPAFAKLATRK
ncbi:hypothetical protein LP419_36105 [Massilia sp. H-1]|nr:hypothetical protein LP419_36105 [Massilia sp. H-1]